MTIRFTIIVLILFNSIIQFTYAQTIAVSQFNTSNVYATPVIAAKLTRLELVKLNKYVVMDQADMTELIEEQEMENCYGKNCLISIGEKLNVPYIISGSIDGLGNKIVITIKLIDVTNKTIKYSLSMEFENQEEELQRMIGIVLQEMHGIEPNPEIKKQLAYRNNVILSNNVNHLNNSGPRMGLAYFHPSEMADFMKRPSNQGGLNILPVMSNLGYQLEGQYIGTQNFSALAEVIFNVAGMEQGRFLPSLSLLNGFRFGSKNWEFAFGPSFGFRRTTEGFFTEEGKNTFGREAGRFWSKSEFYNAGYSHAVLDEEGYKFTENLNRRGTLEINTNWLMAFGRTFKAGALNIPVNAYYIYNKFGGAIGMSVGFNVTTHKSNANK